MTRRIVLLFAAVGAVAAALVMTSTAASAQIGFPGFDIVALLRAILESLPPFLRSFLGPILNALIATFGGGCTPPFCASP